ncbi:cdk-activating kinase assembly factor mat1, partial [Nannochloropsis oceanica]
RPNGVEVEGEGEVEEGGRGQGEWVAHIVEV